MTTADHKHYAICRAVRQWMLSREQVEQAKEALRLAQSDAENAERHLAELITPPAMLEGAKRDDVDGTQPHIFRTIIASGALRAINAKRVEWEVPTTVEEAKELREWQEPKGEV